MRRSHGHQPTSSHNWHSTAVPLSMPSCSLIGESNGCCIASPWAHYQESGQFLKILRPSSIKGRPFFVPEWCDGHSPVQGDLWHTGAFELLHNSSSTCPESLTLRQVSLSLLVWMSRKCETSTRFPSKSVKTLSQLLWHLCLAGLWRLTQASRSGRKGMYINVHKEQYPYFRLSPLTDFFVDI